MKHPTLTNMYQMFHQANAFNQDIGRWNVGKVTNMSLMFAYIYTFNQDIGRWNVGNVTNMSSMFDEANQSPISWLKVVARLNIQDILVTLLTSQSPMYWLKEGVL
jgi:surface protein